MPLLLTIATVMTEMFGQTYPNIQPKIGHDECSFSGNFNYVINEQNWEIKNIWLLLGLLSRTIWLYLPTGVLFTIMILVFLTIGLRGKFKNMSKYPKIMDR